MGCIWYWPYIAFLSTWFGSVDGPVGESTCWATTSGWWKYLREKFVYQMGQWMGRRARQPFSGLDSESIPTFIRGTTFARDFLSMMALIRGIQDIMVFI